MEHDTYGERSERAAMECRRVGERARERERERQRGIDADTGREMG
jgi:hypothetical protein